MTATKHTRWWIGPSGWSYDDWHGIVYPARRTRAFKPLAHIARYFNAVEVNSTFYRMPSPRMTANWPRLVPADFRFTFKLTQVFTHSRDDFPSPNRVDQFRHGVQPIRDAGLLGPLLIQFPWSFRYCTASAHWLRRLAEAFDDFDRFIEVRHRSWAAPEALDLIRDLGNFTNIDQPTLRDCLGPTTHVFGNAAYVRLHGRNAHNWFADDQPAFERYNYLYTNAEIAEWVQRLNAMADHAHDVYVFANNHYKGQGPANALEIKSIVERKRVPIPPTLVETYPRLANIAEPPADTGLFGQPLH